MPLQTFSFILLSIYLYRKAADLDNHWGCDATDDRYFRLSAELGKSLRNGEVVNAAVLALDVQSAETVHAKRFRFPLGTSSRNIYNINDALGPAAFLEKDYLTAGDYLLKSSGYARTGPRLNNIRARSSACPRTSRSRVQGRRTNVS